MRQINRHLFIPILAVYGSGAAAWPAPAKVERVKQPSAVPARPEEMDVAAPAQAATRDSGLVRGITVLPLSASILNSVVGVGIFTLPAAVALQAGAAAPAAYLFTALIMAAITICFAEASSRVPTSGGAYGTVQAAFGPAAGFVVGVLFLVTDVLASGGIAAALADMAGSRVLVLGGGVGRVVTLFGLYAALAGINLIGVERTARLLTVGSVIKLLPLVLFLLLGLCSLGVPAPAGPAPPQVTFAGFGRGLLLTVFAFQGMEIALGASGEVRDPNRTLPRALFLSMLFVLILYLGTQLSAQHLLGSGLAVSAAPLADAARQYGPLPQAILLAGGALSMLCYMASDILGTSRMLFAMGRDGTMPRFIGRVHKLRQVPVNAVLTYVAAGFIVAVTGSFLELVVLSGLTTVFIYMLNCGAALVLRRRNVAMAGVPLDFPALPAAAVIGLLGMLAMLAAANWQELAGLSGVAVVSLAVYYVRKLFFVEKKRRKTFAFSATPGQAANDA
jgi:amino acid transporter